MILFLQSNLPSNSFSFCFLCRSFAYKDTGSLLCSGMWRGMLSSRILVDHQDSENFVLLTGKTCFILQKTANTEKGSSVRGIYNKFTQLKNTNMTSKAAEADNP